MANREKDKDGAAAPTRSAVVVKKDAFRLAKAWVKNMSAGAGEGSEDEEDAQPDSGRVPEPRPARLGLGAKYLSHSQASSLASPVEKKLRMKAKGGKRNSHGVEEEQEGVPESLDVGATEDSKTAAYGRKQRNSAADLFNPTKKNSKRKRS